MTTIWGSYARISGLLIMFTMASLHAQQNDTTDALQAAAPRIFIDCSMCDIDYIRTEIGFVNYVRDRNQADVHILITQQQTGSGGTEYTLTYYGLQRYTGLHDTIKYVSKKDDTQDITRRGLVRVMKTGLLRYAMRTPLSDYFQVQYHRPSAGAQVSDRWNYWTFSISTNGFFNGESQQKYYSMSGNLSANRTTEDWKLHFSLSSSYNENRYEFSIGDETIKSRSIRRSQSFSGNVVRSLDAHWSAGLFGSMLSSTYSNIDFSIGMKPGIEFNIFPYSESTHRQLRLGYRVGMNYNRYVDTTMYFKKSELLYEHSLSAALSVKQPWGSTSLTLSGNQFLQDLSKNSLDIYGSTSFRILEGLSFNVGGGYTAIHNQVSLPKRSLTLEDVYQSRRQLETQYSFYGNLGITYSFGSMFNNIVNPRFGSSGGSGMVIYYD